VSVHPRARPAQIAKACNDKIVLSLQGTADLVVVLLDREDASGCCGDLAKTVEAALRPPKGRGLSARVVLKDRMFENWLVADLEALRSQPARFKVSEAMRNKIEIGKADGCDAAELLRAAALRKPFDKVKDAEAICERIDPVRAARHSRSFRHLLHVLGDPLYATGCRQSVDPPRPIRVRVRGQASGGSGV
jgi:hypothetical protein